MSKIKQAVQQKPESRPGAIASPGTHRTVKASPPTAASLDVIPDNLQNSRKSWAAAHERSNKFKGLNDDGNDMLQRVAQYPASLARHSTRLKADVCRQPAQVEFAWTCSVE